jgi:transposase
MDTKLLFQLALGNISPWEVMKIEFLTKESGIKELHLHLDFPAGSVFNSATGEVCKAHDAKKHTWRHLNFFQHECYLTARVPRVKDSSGRVTTITVPWAASNTGFTLLFEAYVMSLIELEMPVSCVAELVGEYDQRIWNIFHRNVKQARIATDYSNITKVAIDETSARKGHDYVTVAVDLERRRVFEAVVGKSQQEVRKVAEFLDQNGSSSEKVDQVCIDMSPAFIAGCVEYLPSAAITFDRFHVTAVVGKAMDKLRKIEQKECKELKGHKYTLLRNPNSLSEKKEAELQNLLKLYPNIGEGYRLKELLRSFWEFDDIDQAEMFLNDWCDQVKKSGIFPFQEAARTIKAHWTGIINFVKSKITNGIIEGINSKIQLAKKRARGYRNRDNFISMILFISGRLQFN